MAIRCEYVSILMKLCMKISILGKQIDFADFFLQSFLICFQSCVIYQLRSGSIVYQSGALSNALDGPCRRNLTQLDEMMRKTFTSDIEQQSGVGGKAMCCKSNACNAAIPKVTKNPSSPSFFVHLF